jgi:hypothetical protein
MPQAWIDRGRAHDKKLKQAYLENKKSPVIDKSPKKAIGNQLNSRPAVKPSLWAWILDLFKNLFGR